MVRWWEVTYSGEPRSIRGRGGGVNQFRWILWCSVLHTNCPVIEPPPPPGICSKTPSPKVFSRGTLTDGLRICSQSFPVNTDNINLTLCGKHNGLKGHSRFLKIKIIADKKTVSYLNKGMPTHFNTFLQDMKIKWGAERRFGSTRAWP